MAPLHPQRLPHCYSPTIHAGHSQVPTFYLLPPKRRERHLRDDGKNGQPAKETIPRPTLPTAVQHNIVGDDANHHAPRHQYPNCAIGDKAQLHGYYFATVSSLPTPSKLNTPKLIPYPSHIIHRTRTIPATIPYTALSPPSPITSTANYLNSTLPTTNSAESLATLIPS